MSALGARAALQPAGADGARQRGGGLGGGAKGRKSDELITKKEEKGLKTFDINRNNIQIIQHTIYILDIIEIYIVLRSLEARVEKRLRPGACLASCAASWTRGRRHSRRGKRCRTCASCGNGTTTCWAEQKALERLQTKLLKAAFSAQTKLFKDF